MKNRRVLIGMLAATLALGACGGDDSKTSDDASTSATTVVDNDSGTDEIVKEDDGGGGTMAAEDVDVCSWFTQADAQAASGGADVSLSDDATILACEYIDAAAYEDSMTRIGVTVNYHPEALAGRTLEEWLTETDPDAKSEPVESIEGAIAIIAESYPSVIIAHDGGVVQVIALNGTLDNAIQLAEVVVGNF